MVKLTERTSSDVLDGIKKCVEFAKQKHGVTWDDIGTRMQDVSLH